MLESVVPELRTAAGHVLAILALKHNLLVLLLHVTFQVVLGVGTVLAHVTAKWLVT